MVDDVAGNIWQTLPVPVRALRAQVRGVHQHRHLAILGVRLGLAREPQHVWLVVGGCQPRLAGGSGRTNTRAEIGARLTLSLSAHTDARRRRRKFNVAPDRDRRNTFLKCKCTYRRAEEEAAEEEAEEEEEEEDIQRRWSACSQ